jgi:hypothetical protein
MIYVLQNDFENTYSLFIDGIDLLTKMPSYKARYFAQTRLAEWVEPQATFYRSEHFKGIEGTLPDISNWATGVLVFSPTAHSLLASELANCGEFLPISLEGKTYYLFNTLYVIPDEAVDESNAVERVDSGVHFGRGNVSYDEMFLEREKVAVFKSNTNKLLHSFGTERFKKLYESKGFKGLTFHPVT